VSSESRPGHSIQKQIARAAGQVMLLFIVSRALGLAREMIIGARFGTGADLDAYLAAFRLPDLLFQLVAGGALGSAFIPAFTAHLTKNDERGAWRLASSIINLVLIVLSVVALLAGILAKPLVAHVIAPGFSPEQQLLTVQLLRGLLVSTVIFGISGIVMGILNSYQHFFAPALAPAVYNLGIICGAWFLAPEHGVHGLVVGAVAGAAWHLLVQLPALFERRPKYTATLGLEDPDVREVGRLMAPRVVGLAVIQLNFLVNTIIASGLGAGSLSALNFAWLIMLLPQGIVAQGIATAAFPTFSALAAQNRRAEMRLTFSGTLRAILFLSIPATVGLFVLRVPLIRMLLERGEFSEGSTAAVAMALAFYAWGLVGHSVLEIAARAFYALHNTLTPVLAGVGAVVLNVLLSIALKGSMGFAGLALANTVATTLEMIVLLLLLSRRMGGLDGSRVWQSARRSLLASALLASVLAVPLLLWPEANPWLMGPILLIVGALLYLTSMWIARSDELDRLLDLVRSRTRRAA